MVAIWRHCRRDGMGGRGHLPEAGGVLDQGAWLMEALAIMDDEAARIEEKR